VYYVFCVTDSKQLLLCKKIIFVMEAQFVFYELGTECVCTIYRNSEG